MLEPSLIDLNGETSLRRGQLPGSRIQDEMVFFSQQDGKYYATGPVGADIWDHLESPRTVAEICAHLVGTYQVDPEQCEAQAKEFLKEMLSAGLIVVEND